MGRRAARGDRANGIAGQAGVLAGGEKLIRVEDVDQVMRNATPFGQAASLAVPISKWR